MNKVVILLGPTGVGKTGASIRLAQSLNTEIISADSMQIYRHMDIGTAKPSGDQLRAIKHHLIDIVEPSETFSAGSFIDRVVPIIENLHFLEKIPIVVGGTGLYIKAMTRGIFTGPSADWGLREDLLKREERNPGSLYRYLQKLDAEAASKVMKKDVRRIVRALEVCLKTKTGITELREKLTRPLPYEFIRIGLARERTELYHLIEKRVDSMLARGLVDEVRNLLLLGPGKTAMQAIGYKEIAAHMRGDCLLDEAVRLVKKRSRNYAKRQLTWFRQESDILWCDITGLCADEEIFQAIAILLRNRLT